MKPFGPEALLDCYARGVFPMADSRHDNRIFLIDPDQRGIIPLDQFHIPRRLQRTLKSEPFEIRTNTAFRTVVEACAEAGPGRENTWINDPILNLYSTLFARGCAHSVECWQNGRLMGGLYGVSLGAAFFGESMFSRATDASKIALCHLVARLKFGGYRLLDTQFLTDHLKQFGTQEIGRDAYKVLLHEAIAQDSDFFALPPKSSGLEIAQICLSSVVVA